MESQWDSKVRLRELGAALLICDRAGRIAYASDAARAMIPVPASVPGAVAKALSAVAGGEVVEWSPRGDLGVVRHEIPGGHSLLFLLRMGVYRSRLARGLLSIRSEHPDRMIDTMAREVGSSVASITLLADQLTPGESQAALVHAAERLAITVESLLGYVSAESQSSLTSPDTLIDTLRSLHRQRADARVSLPGHPAIDIYVVRGELVHASAGSELGRSVLLRALSSSIVPVVRSLPSSIPRSIHTPFRELLISALAELEEGEAKR